MNFNDTLTALARSMHHWPDHAGDSLVFDGRVITIDQWRSRRIEIGLKVENNMNESTLVPREEMSDLDWLARNVHEFPAGREFAWISRDVYFSPVAPLSGNYFTKQQWLARRTELQKKPSWECAPEWAEWLAQHASGFWCWGGGVPCQTKTTWYGCSEDWSTQWSGMSGEVLGEWRDTLEKRPETRLKSMSGVHSDGDMLALHDELKDVDMNKFAPFVSVEDAATAKQPAPKGSGNPILGMVLSDLTNRALEGREKYGEPLLAHNGRNPLWDAYQEALDLAMYLRQAIEEQK